MNKSLVLTEDDAKNDLEMQLRYAPGRLAAGVSEEFYKSGEQAQDRRAERAVKVAVICLLMMIVTLVGFLIYLGLNQIF